MRSWHSCDLCDGVLPPAGHVCLHSLHWVHWCRQTVLGTDRNSVVNQFFITCMNSAVKHVEFPCSGQCLTDLKRFWFCSDDNVFSCSGKCWGFYLLFNLDWCSSAVTLVVGTASDELNWSSVYSVTVLHYNIHYLSISIFYDFILPLHYIHSTHLVTSYFADSDYSVFTGC